MNKIIKMLITETIHNNRIIRTANAAGDRYIIVDKSGRQIMTVVNGWAINNYYISANNKNILSVQWDASDGKPLTSQQKDMIDIINACKEKIDFQETAQTMNSHELELAKFLQQHLCHI